MAKPEIGSHDVKRASGETPDRVLLERFIAQREEAAFARLVQRYGPLVLSVCRRILHHEQDAEDAFQATFLVLARKAGSINKRDSVASWLYGVACRIAKKAKTRGARRAVEQPELPDVPAPQDAQAAVWRDLRPVLDEEVNRLPQKYRLPFLLCYFEGRTNEEAARQLGCPLGTVLSRLARARGRLRSRLMQRGIALSASALTALLAEQAAATAMPAALAPATVKAALLFAGGKSLAKAALSANAVALTKGFLKGSKLKGAATVLLALAVALLSLLLLSLALTGKNTVPANPALTGKNTVPARSDQEKIQGTWIADRVEQMGQVLPNVKMQFGADNCEMVLGAVRIGPYPYRLDPTRAPKTIDITPAPGTTSPGIYHWPGIYQLEEDLLTICLNHGGPDRPTGFATQPDRKTVYLYVFRREQATEGADLPRPAKQGP